MFGEKKVLRNKRLRAGTPPGGVGEVGSRGSTPISDKAQQPTDELLRKMTPAKKIKRPAHRGIYRRSPLSYRRIAAFLQAKRHIVTSKSQLPYRRKSTFPPIEVHRMESYSPSFIRAVSKSQTSLPWRDLKSWYSSFLRCGAEIANTLLWMNLKSRYDRPYIIMESKITNTLPWRNLKYWYKTLHIRTTSNIAIKNQPHHGIMYDTYTLSLII